MSQNIDSATQILWEKTIHLIFEDNGVGFDSANQSKGIGLQSINIKYLHDRQLQSTIKKDNFSFLMNTYH